MWPHLASNQKMYSSSVANGQRQSGCRKVWWQQFEMVYLMVYSALSCSVIRNWMQGDDDAGCRIGLMSIQAQKDSRFYIYQN